MRVLLLVLIGIGSGELFAAAGMPAVVNFYQLIVVETFGLGREWLPVASSVLVLLLSTLLGIAYYIHVQRVMRSDTLAPSGLYASCVEFLLGFLDDLTADSCGKYSRTFLPLLVGFFFFILVCNLTGLFPGLPPATESISTTLALGLIAFFAYNYAGVREHGWGYGKQFVGPLLFIAPLFLIIEIFSHLSRPLSLSLRLMVNIFADHLLLNVFTGLTYLLLPAALLFFGLLVACLQSFVFTLLTSIYISLAVSHDH